MRVGPYDKNAGILGVLNQFVGISLLAFGFCVVPAQTASQNRSHPSKASDGTLHLQLIQEGSEQKFRLLFHNTGHQPIFVNLGVIVGNDKELCPTRIQWLLTSANGQIHRFRSDFGVIGGRLDPMIVPLAEDTIYSLVADFRSFPSGRYSLRAQYTGGSVSAKAANGDMKGLALIHYWTGTLESNSLNVNLH